jgi:hypothetical protein
MKHLIIESWYSDEDKESVIANLAQRISTKTKSNRSFTRLFWTQPPHAFIDRLTRMNSRAFQSEFNQTIFRLLSWDPNAFYEDDEFYKTHMIMHASDWSDGILLHRWEKYARDPNPHHRIPRSRWGTNTQKNLWQVDRTTHDDFHRVFQNLTPVEQLFLILQIYDCSFSRSFKDALNNILRVEFTEPGIYLKSVVSPENFV